MEVGAGDQTQAHTHITIELNLYDPSHCIGRENKMTSLFEVKSIRGLKGLDSESHVDLIVNVAPSPHRNLH